MSAFSAAVLMAPRGWIARRLWPTRRLRLFTIAALAVLAIAISWDYLRSDLSAHSDEHGRWVRATIESMTRRLEELAVTGPHGDATSALASALDGQEVSLGGWRLRLFTAVDDELDGNWYWVGVYSAEIPHGRALGSSNGLGANVAVHLIARPASVGAYLRAARFDEEREFDPWVRITIPIAPND